jgi:hypothetical protein
MTKPREYRHPLRAVIKATQLLVTGCSVRATAAETGLSKSVVGRMANGTHRFRFDDEPEARRAKEFIRRLAAKSRMSAPPAG